MMIGACEPRTPEALVARAEGKTPEILQRLVKDIESALFKRRPKMDRPK